MIKQIIKRVISNERKLYQFSLILLFLVFAYQLPFLNIIFSPLILFLIVYYAATFVFHFSLRTTIIMALLFLCVSIPWILVGSRQHAEPIGEAVFAMLLVGFIQEATRLRKEKK